MKTDIPFFLEHPCRMAVFIGAYGSGKSEVSVNVARNLAASGTAVTLADLDIINPFYRSSDAADLLAAAGVRLIRPVFAGTNVDVPAIGADVQSLFDAADGFSVLDIGGEDLGARVLSSLRSRMDEDRVCVLLVINPHRPDTATAADVIKLAAQLEQASGLRITGLVDNTNLLEPSLEQTEEAVHPVVRDVADRTGIPVAFRSVLQEDSAEDGPARLSDGTPILYMKRSIFYDF